MEPSIESIHPSRRLATTEARTQLPQLVNELGSADRPAHSLVDRAVEIGPRAKGGTWLVPEVDAQAALGREASLLERVNALEDELENIAIGFFLESRLDRSSGSITPAADVIRELGFGELADDLP